MKIRIKYAKTGALRYIGHLDVMRYFQKAIRRAHLDVTYSQGYSPHQLISFAAPLGLGVTSEGEYFDAQMNSVTTSKDMIDRLNETMADGMEVIDIVLLHENAKAAMAVVAGSDYLVSIKPDYYDSNLFLSEFQNFMNQEKIEVTKVTKTKEAVIDIKPFIFEAYIKEDKIYLKLSTGSVDNIKPELVMEAFCNYLNLSYEKIGFRVHRLETYMEDENGNLVSLLCAGETF